MKYVGVFAIDSWHLTGGHFPNVSVSFIYDDINDVLDWIMDRVNSYQLTLDDGTSITREMLKERVERTKYRYVQIHFEHPREGEIIIRFEE
jgi:hypothetical protein